MLNIQKAAVIGAGTMGAQIAAHLANVGIPVLLLDVAGGEATAEEAARGLMSSSPAVRNRVVTTLFERMRKLSPAPFFTPETAALVRLGNVEDNLAEIGDADWIVEAVLERLDLKQSLHRRISGLARPDALVTTNTSGLPIDQITEGLPAEYRRRFFATHFFNPPRYMKLLELVPGRETDPARLRAFAGFAESVLGKGIVVGKDTPGFIANRIGCFDIQTALWLTLEEGLTVDEVDAITGPAIGRPRSATFRLCDIIGIDLLGQICRNMRGAVGDEEERKILQPPPFVAAMIERGWWGEKKGQGFYKRVPGDKGSAIHTLDYHTLEYRPQQKPAFASLEAVGKISDPAERIRALCAADDKAARFAWKHLSRVLCQTASLIPEIADDLGAVDDAIRWGYNWELGPFEIWDALGVAATVQRLEREGRPVPDLARRLLAAGHQRFHEVRGTQRRYFSPARGDYAERTESPQALSLSRLRAAGPRVVRENASASLLDLGDGVACFEFHTKMNAIGEETLALLRESLEAVRAGFTGLVIAGRGPHFSAGANLKEFAAHIENGRWDALAGMLRNFQEAACNLRYFERPVVAALQGYALGGGCEFVLGCDHVAAFAESATGLSEVRVGLVPAGHGTKELLVRNTEHIPKSAAADYLSGVRQAWETITQAKISTSAPDAARLRFLRTGEWTRVMNKDWLLGEAKAKAIELARGYRPSAPRADLPAVGQDGVAALKAILQDQRAAGRISEYDETIATKVALVLCGGDLPGLRFVTERHILELEREAFLSLCGDPRTLARIRHTLNTGKPLKN